MTDLEDGSRLLDLVPGLLHYRFRRRRLDGLGAPRASFPAVALSYTTFFSPSRLVTARATLRG